MKRTEKTLSERELSRTFKRAEDVGTFIAIVLILIAVFSVIL